MLRTFIAIALAGVLCCGCAVRGDKTPYPPPESLDLAPVKRQEFVVSFLQGNWCEAQSLFAMSVEDYIRRDDFCAAAYNHLAFWRLKAYVGLDDPELLDKAREYRRLGFGCPDSAQLALMDREPAARDYPQKDGEYRDLLEKRDYKTLAARLAKEKDALFASVYARKTGLSALERGQTETARDFFDLARKVDARQGWIVLLREDWKLLAPLAASTKDKEVIAERIRHLDDLVRPCR